MARKDLLIWHQGALGDLLLAGPALAAISRYYSRARITALGHPERWALFSRSLPLDEIWDSGEARWAPLFAETAVAPQLRERLAPFRLALVFATRPQPLLLKNLGRAGIPAIHWLPSFPETGVERVAAIQARHLGALGIEYVPAPFRLETGLPPGEHLPELAGHSAWLAVAPGSGHPRKNWPLSHYYEVSRALAWEYDLGVIWLAGPVERNTRPYLSALAAAQSQVLLANRPLARVGQILSRCRLYLGNDSGLTHLAAAVAEPEVMALFGPTDPRVWAPLGPQVHVLAGSCPQAPCAQGRTINCPEPRCLTELSPDTVLAMSGQVLSARVEMGGGGAENL